jgi:hypothetical protein
MTMRTPADAERHLADSIVYLCALLADRPRLVDRYIDYFGETPQYARDSYAGSHASWLAGTTRVSPRDHASAHLTQPSRRVATAERGGGP